MICFYGGGVLIVRIYFWVWKFFDYMFLVMEIDELNFYVAEPKESRESPNVGKCMGSIVS